MSVSVNERKWIENGFDYADETLQTVLVGEDPLLDPKETDQLWN